MRGNMCAVEVWVRVHELWGTHASILIEILIEDD